MEGLDRDIMFVALTRPQLLLGVTYGFAIGNAILTTELFLVFKSIWVLPVAVLVHLAGTAASLREPRLFELWLLKARRCPRVRNHSFWRCNAYCP